MQEVAGAPASKSSVLDAGPLWRVARILDAKQFLDAVAILTSIVVIGLIGFVAERLVFGSLERATTYRWGTACVAKG